MSSAMENILLKECDEQLDRYIYRVKCLIEGCYEQANAHTQLCKYCQQTMEVVPNDDIQTIIDDMFYGDDELDLSFETVSCDASSFPVTPTSLNDDGDTMEELMLISDYIDDSKAAEHTELCSKDHDYKHMCDSSLWDSKEEITCNKCNTSCRRYSVYACNRKNCYKQMEVCEECSSFLILA